LWGWEKRRKKEATDGSKDHMQSLEGKEKRKVKSDKRSRKEKRQPEEGENWQTNPFPLFFEKRERERKNRMVVATRKGEKKKKRE